MSDGNTNNTVFIQRLFTSRDNFVDGNVEQATANALAFVGQEGRIWWEPTTNNFYYSDGNTPGGFPIGGGGSGNGVPGGPTDSIQYNAGGGSFGGSSNFTISGNGINVVGDVNAAYFIGDGSQLTDLPVQPGTYSNTNVAAYLTTAVISTTGNITGGNIVTVGNVTGNFFIGNGSQLTGIVSSYGNSNVAAYLPTYSGNIAGGNIGVSGAVNAVGEITSFANLVTSGEVQATGNVTGGNITTVGLISATGNVTGNFFIGDGSQLTNLPSGTSNKIYNGNSYANIATADGNLVVSANGTNWTFDTTGNLTIPGNFNAGVASPAPSINGFSSVNVDTVHATGNISATGNVSGGNISTSGWISGNNISASGNANVGNLTLPEGGNINLNTNVWIKSDYSPSTLLMNTSNGNAYVSYYQDESIWAVSSNDDTTGPVAARATFRTNLVDIDNPLVNIVTIPGNGDGTPFVWVFNGAGTLTAPGIITTPGNVEGDTIYGNNFQYSSGKQAGGIFYGDLSGSGELVSGDTLTTDGYSLTVAGDAYIGSTVSATGVVATGNITANAFAGDGSQLTGVATPSSVKQVLGLTMIYGGR